MVGIGQAGLGAVGMDSRGFARSSLSSSSLLVAVAVGFEIGKVQEVMEVVKMRLASSLKLELVAASAPAVVAVAADATNEAALEVLAWSYVLGVVAFARVAMGVAPVLESVSWGMAES